MSQFRRFGLVFLAVVMLVTFSAAANSCSQEQVVYQRPVAELNQKAKQLMDNGQSQAAVGRLEAALDLMPNEPNTMYNLAVAYQQNEQYEQSLAIFEELLKTHGADRATILKNMGIVHEALADNYVAKSEEEPTPPPPKRTPAEVKDLSQKALYNYNIALQYYQDALGKESNPGQLQAQIDNLQARIKQVKEGKKAG